jgi:hypothetical protein
MRDADVICENEGNVWGAETKNDVDVTIASPVNKRSRD